MRTDNKGCYARAIKDFNRATELGDNSARELLEEAQNRIMSANPNYRTLSGFTGASVFYLPASAHIHRSSVYRDSGRHKRCSSGFGELQKFNITLGALFRHIRHGAVINLRLFAQGGICGVAYQSGGFGRGDAAGEQMKISTGPDSSGFSIASESAHYARAQEAERAAVERFLKKKGR